MANENFLAAHAAIWENPDKLFNHPFRRASKAWESLRGDGWKQGQIRLLQQHSGRVTVICNRGSELNGQTFDAITYAERYIFNTLDKWDTLQKIADLYGLSLRFSEEQRRKINRSEIARAICPCLIESLRKNPTGAAGTYITQTRALSIDAHFGELTAESLKRAKDDLRNRGIAYTEDDFKALQLTEWNARNGYNVVIPYYSNGNVVGFILRNTTDNPNAPKYLYSQEMGRGGYCDRLKIGKPTFVVEGQMDAIRLIQAYANDADAPNVVAMGGAKISEDIGELFKRHNIDVVTYVPDVEYNEQGERKTKIAQDAIQAFQTVKAYGEPVITTLFVSELETPKGVNLNGYKIDADTYGKEHGNHVLACSVEGNATDWYIWELKQLEQWERTADGWNSWNIENYFRDRFRNLYNRAGVWERQPIRDYIRGNSLYVKYAITPQVLDEVDADKKNRDYYGEVKALHAELTKAIENGANPTVIADITARLNDLQATNTRDDWGEQFNRAFADGTAEIAEQPEAIKTKWELGVIRKNNPYPFRKTENIEFTPADVTIFCASTSHGKTMILFQSALDLVRNTDKTYLYVSGEETQRQLLERALNLYIDIPTTEDGRTANGGYCLISKTRRKTILSVIQEKPAPEAYGGVYGSMFEPEHYTAVKREIQHKIQEYGQRIHPRLKLIHTDASIESIAANIKWSVEDMRAKGVDVGGVFIDYMQILNADSGGYSRHDELKTICKVLHSCAGEIDAPIIAAAQMNRDAITGGIDEISNAKIGEGSDIEKIGCNIYFVYQTDKTPLYLYVDKKKGNAGAEDDEIINPANVGKRAERIFTRETNKTTGAPLLRLKKGYLYVEQLKARYGETGGWALLPFDGERGQIGESDKDKMAE